MGSFIDNAHTFCAQKCQTHQNPMRENDLCVQPALELLIVLNSISIVSIYFIVCCAHCFHTPEQISLRRSHTLCLNCKIRVTFINYSLIISLNTVRSNSVKLHRNIINYRVLIFTQVAPLSPLTLPSSALPCSIREASLVRTSGKAARNGANGSHKAALLIAWTLHNDPPNPSATAIG